MVLFQCLWKIEMKLSDVTGDISENGQIGSRTCRPWAPRLPLFSLSQNVLVQAPPWNKAISISDFLPPNYLLAFLLLSTRGECTIVYVSVMRLGGLKALILSTC